MIKFFRKIRQNLLMENKTGKYLKYAIGEIVLVVIGILIALQINNWNEARKNKTVERGFIINLISDLESDVKHIDKVIIKNEKKLIEFDTVLSYSYRNINALKTLDTLYFYTYYAIANRVLFRNMNRTLNQYANLENSVVRKNVADSIAKFQQLLLPLNEQSSSYRNSINNIQTIANKLFNFNVFIDNTYWNENGRSSKPMKIKSNIDLQLEFFNLVWIARGTTRYYISDVSLKGHRQKTKDFIGFLETEYNLKQ